MNKLKYVFLLIGLGCACLLAETKFEQVDVGLPSLGATHLHWLDYDNDGRPDLLVDGSRLYRNVTEAGVCRFVDVSAKAGLSDGGVALCFDYDNDGWCDIVTSAPHVWHNLRNGKFEDVAKKLGFSPNRKAMTMAAGDVDGDGRADLFIGMGENWNDGKNSEYFRAELWLNKHNKWQECAKIWGVDRKTYARGALFADVNGDGKQDIFVANYRLQENLLWINNGFSFDECALRYGVAGEKDERRYFDPFMRRNFGPRNGHGIGCCWSDFDNDGRLDLLVANLVHKYVGHGSNGKYDIRGYVCGDSTFYHRRGNGIGFTDWRDELGVRRRPIGGLGKFKGDELWAGCVPADFDNDGWEDIFIPQIYNLDYAKSVLLVNMNGNVFADIAETAGICRIDTYAGAWADFDGDGRMDLVTAGRPQVDAPSSLVFYRNLSTAGNWIKVRLLPSHNLSAIGALVTTKAGKLTMTRLNSAGISTYGQQNDPVLHFGIAENSSAEISVKWPDGKCTSATANAGETLTINY